MKVRTRVRPRPLPARRESERQDTRRRLLETAGEVFAERGVDGATGLEICQRASVNSAAVNYYFGGIEGLYEAVLIEARSRAPSLEAVSAVITEYTDARARLRAIIGLVIGVLTGPSAHSWILRILMREAVSPSPAFERLILEAEGLPKLRMFKAIIAEIMDLPDDHPAVAQGCISVFAPCTLMLIGERRILERAYPDLDLGPSGAPMLVDRMVAFALGGLAGMAEAGAAKVAGYDEIAPRPPLR